MKKSVVTIYLGADDPIGQTIQASVVGLDRTKSIACAVPTLVLPSSSIVFHIAPKGLC
jgi:hypothetical protein